MRKASAVVAILAVASTAMAVPTLVTLPKVTNINDGLVRVGTLPTSITPDGQYVGGTAGLGFAGSGKDTGFVWDAVNGSKSFNAGGLQMSVNGIGYRYPTAGGVELVVGGANASDQSMSMSTNGGLTWVKQRRTGTAYDGSMNTVAGTGGPVIYSTFFTPNSGTPTLYIDGRNDAGWLTTAAVGKGTSSASTVRGVSSGGVAVGSRQVSGVDNNYVLTYTGTTPGNVYTAGLAGDNRGSLWDIADNGTIAGGQSPVSDGRTGSWPYIRVMSTGAVKELPNLGGTSQTVNNGLVYGVSPDGQWAVGMDYTNGIELAVLWDLRDLNNIQITNLTQFATDAGILDGFTGNLRRANAMGIDANGNPVITGIGYNASAEANGWTGYVLTVPEPATLTFLALGGLAMLRRRR